MIKNKLKQKKGIAVFEICVLMIGIIAFSGLVSGADTCNTYCQSKGFEAGEDISIDSEAKEECENNGGTYTGELGCCCFGGKGSLTKAIGTLGTDKLWDKVKEIIPPKFQAPVKTAFYASFIYSGINEGLQTLGIGEDVSEASSRGVTAAYVFHQAFFINKEKSTAGWASNFAGKILGDKWAGYLASPLAALGVGALVFAMTYKQEKSETFTFTCESWQAPSMDDGNSCEKCNEQDLVGCSEYQCKSLGQGCELWEGKCIWLNEKDTKFPVITLNQDALLEDYVYSPVTATSPGDKGVEVKNTQSSDGCAPAFTPLSFGVNTDEPAKCKWDIERKSSYEEMAQYIGSAPEYNHTIVLSMPSLNQMIAEEPLIQNDGNYQLYFRCMDGNGNVNPANFVFNFCVDKGPDTTPPIIVSSNLVDGGSVAFGQNSIDFIAYINEPATCKWDSKDVSYETMAHTMTCAESVSEMNSQMLYPCSTTLTGLKDREENRFFFKCEDSEGNVNSESQPKEGFVLMGTQELSITSIGPNETIRGPNENVKATIEVETASGADQGRANCYYSETEEDKDYVMFYYEDDEMFSHYKHTQDLYLSEGTYKYYIKCIDIGGNSDTGAVRLEVESDSGIPKVARTYKEGNQLKIITNEKAECVYSTKDCVYEFEDGIATSTSDEIKHSLTWDTSVNYYIKCGDEYGNQPSGSECSIIVRGV